MRETEQVDREGTEGVVLSEDTTVSGILQQHGPVKMDPFRSALQDATGLDFRAAREPDEEEEEEDLDFFADDEDEDDDLEEEDDFDDELDEEEEDEEEELDEEEF